MSKKPQSNAADETEVLTAKQRDKLRADRDADDLKFILSTKQGRRFVWRKLSECGVFKSSFVTNAGIYFNEGMRNVGLILLAEINEHAPEAYTLMLRESKEDDL